MNLDDLIRRVKARMPVVPRATRDDLLAEFEELRRRYEALGGDAAAYVGDRAPVDPEIAPFLTFAPPGHFYSPIPRMSEALGHVDATFADRPTELPGIDLRLDEQLALARRLTAFQADFDPPSAPSKARRYHTANPSYGRGDALVLDAMLRELRPRRIVEIGSGYSSALMLDTIDVHMDGEVAMTFIEPYADVLRAQFRPGDAERCEVIEQPLQDVDPARFDELGSGDLLFIDSTHVVRPGSDVLREIFEILPRLRPGVIVHLHDIFYPFEYPPFWVREGRLWGESYLLRAFLAHNSQFAILLWPDYLHFAAPAEFEAALPKMVGEGFGAIWLRRADVGDEPQPQAAGAAGTVDAAAGEPDA